MKLYIKNCNNIKEANLEIPENNVSIFFAPNGTGKSTIAKALYWRDDKEKIQTMQPYGSKDPQTVDCPVNKVKIFDESYITKFLFSDNSKSLFHGNKCYDVFYKNENFETGKIIIQEKISKLAEAYKELNPDNYIQNFYAQLLNGKKKFEFLGGYSEILKGKGYGFNNEADLNKYEPFYSKDLSSVSKWSKWKMEGDKYTESDTCPFCGSSIKEETIKKETELFKNIFKSSAIEKTDLFITFLQECLNRKYITEEKFNSTISILGTKNNQEIIKEEILSLVKEIADLCSSYEKIQSILDVEVQVGNAKDLQQEFINRKIKISDDKQFFNTPEIKEKFNNINAEIDSLAKKFHELLIAYSDTSKTFKKHAEENQRILNEILRNAGFQYTIKITPDKNSLALLSLHFNDTKVNKIDERLSWGERNCFSMIMFLFECIHDNPDLIILDDPISSFDDNKKYAMIRQMFFEKNYSFKNKTVLLLTHDSHPIIEFYLHKVKGTNFKYLLNENGIITSKNITPEDDLVIATKWSKNIASAAKLEKEKYNLLSTRIVNLRKYIEFNSIEKSEETINAYHIISSLIHNRPKMTKKIDDSKNNDVVELTDLKNDDPDELSDSEKESGMKYIKEFIKDFDYENSLSEFNYINLLSIFLSDNYSWYERILALRLLLEINKSQLNSLKSEYPSIAKFINQTNHIENDYILQLDPIKYMALDQKTYKDIINFLARQTYSPNEINAEVKNMLKKVS